MRDKLEKFITKKSVTINKISVSNIMYKHEKGEEFKCKDKVINSNTPSNEMYSEPVSVERLG